LKESSFEVKEDFSQTQSLREQKEALANSPLARASSLD